MTQTNARAARPLRLWPGLTFAALLVLFRFVLPALTPGKEIFDMSTDMIGMFAGVLFALLIFVWWIFFSRAPWADRLLTIAVIAVAMIAIRPLTDFSIQNGFMSRMFYVFAPFTMSLTLVLGVLISRRMSAGARRVVIVLMLLAGAGIWALLRTDGVLGGVSVLHWRWTPTAEQRLLAQGEEAVRPLPPAAASPEPSVTPPAAASAPAVSAPEATVPTPAPTPGAKGRALSEPEVSRVEGRVEWPGFRGPNRNSVVPGVRINTDWSASPPVQLWKRPIGPGWSSFAVGGDLIYTQEQRGDEEIVACYRLSSGDPVWRHRDAARFYESNGGAGPRGTPTLHNGRVYALGATGILNALDARTGAVVWTRNAAKDTGRGLPGWGFTSSPLIIATSAGDIVIVATSGTMAGYDAGTGAPRWTGPKSLGSYSSPHQVTIDDVTQVILLGGSGAVSVDPSTGTELWHNDWTDGGTTIVQPAVIPGGDLLITTSSAMGGLGVRRLHVTQANGAWKVEERWTSNGLKPYFNDFVIHKGHAIGFDGSILASINLEDGKRDWKGGRYGQGQLLLLPDQELLLVVSEEGELALVSALPDKYSEVARIPGIDGKTWNHPVLVGDVLLVRNGEQMAAYRLGR
jgi:outer membrane protein assembly factor BamB